MAGKVNHQFHGKLEQVQTAKQAEMPTIMIEVIEITVFVLVIFTLFFKFKNMVSVNSSRKTPQNQKPEMGTPELTGAPVAARFK